MKLRVPEVRPRAPPNPRIARACDVTGRRPSRDICRAVTTPARRRPAACTRRRRQGRPLDIVVYGGVKST